MKKILKILNAVLLIAVFASFALIFRMTAMSPLEEVNADTIGMLMGGIFMLIFALFAVNAFSSAVKRTAAPAAVRKCIACGNMTDPNSRSCPRCYTVQPGAAITKNCTSCGHVIDTNARSCPKCFVIQPIAPNSTYESSIRRK